jgi:hypothetical protein
MDGLKYFGNLWKTKMVNEPIEQVEAKEVLANRIDDDTILTTPKGKTLTVGEIRHSKRIYKSATPKHDASWYIKWIASAFILTSAMFRVNNAGLDPNLANLLDNIFSFIGVVGWMVVGFLWNDRALILLNAVLVFILASGLFKWIVGG